MNTQIISGNYASATIFTTDNEKTALEEYARKQIQMLCDNPVAARSKIRVMPDVHPGKVGTIGLTMTIGTQILPNLVGVDMGCGMTLASIQGKKMEMQKLDRIVQTKVPAGSEVRKEAHHLANEMDLSELRCAHAIQKEKALCSLGTLGGGNHFIEVDQDDSGVFYLVIHSGSRHLGVEVTEYYLREGQKHLKAQGNDVPYELTYLEGELMSDYLHDLQIAQDYAALNREIMIREITKGMKWKISHMEHCIHNYVDFSGEVPLLRKGAIAAAADTPVIIPINMRDGILLGTGLGNEEWNCSAPHGAGRIYKREDVKSHFTVSAFKSEMKGIYTSCISKDTLDEAPFAYRPLEEIQEAISETVHINRVLRPIYNYKAGKR
nr:RtcB family protein [Eubacterium sp.]